MLKQQKLSKILLYGTHTNIDLFLPIHLPFQKNPSQAVFIKTFQAKKQEIKELIEVLSLHCRVFCFPRSALRKTTNNKGKQNMVPNPNTQTCIESEAKTVARQTGCWDVDIFQKCAALSCKIRCKYMSTHVTGVMHGLYIYIYNYIYILFGGWHLVFLNNRMLHSTTTNFLRSRLFFLRCKFLAAMEFA